MTRCIGGALEEHNLLYPSKYFGMEIKRTPDGKEVSGSYSVVNHVYVNGVRAAALTPGGEALYYLTDQVDSVKVVVNDRGKPVTRTEYLPYGETWFTEGDEGNAPKFNSQELDRETNYYFYNARYYDPEIARFVTADNLVDNESDTQGWNRFSYVKGNPVVYKDPTGHLIDPVSLVAGETIATGMLIYNKLKIGKNEKLDVGSRLNKVKNPKKSISPTTVKEGTVIINYGSPYYNDGKKHYGGGIDIAAGEKDRIISPENGVVSKIHLGEEDESPASYITIKSSKTGCYVTYKHTQHSDKLIEGQAVKAGQIIGTPDLTGKTSGYHLHYEVKDKDGREVDPVKYLKEIQPNLKFEINPKTNTRKMYEKYNTEALRIIDESQTVKEVK